MTSEEEIITLVKDWIRLIPEYSGQREEFVHKLLEDLCPACYCNDPNCQCWNDE